MGHTDFAVHVYHVKPRFRNLLEVELRQFPIKQMMVLEEDLEIKLLTSDGNLQSGLWDTEKYCRPSFAARGLSPSS